MAYFLDEIKYEINGREIDITRFVDYYPKFFYISG